jgi:hypothetical protein
MTTGNQYCGDKAAFAYRREATLFPAHAGMNRNHPEAPSAISRVLNAYLNGIRLAVTKHKIYSFEDAESV